MPKYKVTLSNGKSYVMTASGPPSEADVMAKLGLGAPAEEAPLTLEGHSGTLAKGRMAAEPSDPASYDPSMALLGGDVNRFDPAKNIPANAKALRNNAPMIGAMAGGLAAAPFTGGMSIPGAAALTASGAAGLGGALGEGFRQQTTEGLHIPTGEDVSGMGKEGLTQAILDRVGALPGAAFKAAGKGMYRLGLDASGAALKKLPNIVQRGVEEGLVTTQGARIAEQAAKKEAEDRIAMFPQQRTPTSQIVPDPTTTYRNYQPHDAYADLRTKVSAGRGKTRLLNQLDEAAAELHIDKPQGFTPQELNAFRAREDELGGAAHKAAETFGTPDAALQSEAYAAEGDRARELLRTMDASARPAGAKTLQELNQITRERAEILKALDSPQQHRMKIPAWRLATIGLSGAGGALGGGLAGVPAAAAAYAVTHPPVMRGAGVAAHAAGRGMSAIGPALMKLATYQSPEEEALANTLQLPPEEPPPPPEWWAPKIKLAKSH